MRKVKYIFTYPSFSSPLLIFLVLLSACTPQFQPVQIVENSQARLTERFVIAEDGTKLPLRTWLPGGDPKAVILALHGFNDYSNAFEGAGAFFRQRGMAMYAYDQRGFGRSPVPGIWGDKQNLTNDVKTAVALLKKRYPHKPLYVLGESMGGAVAILAFSSPLRGEAGRGAFVRNADSVNRESPLPNLPPVGEGIPKINGLILSAPAAWDMGGFYHASAWLMAHVMPSHTFTGEDLRIRASDNLPMLMALSNDPLVIKATRADAIYGLVGLMEEAHEKAPQVQVPTLLLYGAHDEVIKPELSEGLAERYAAPLAVKRYGDGYHMLLRDLQAKRVMQDIAAWIVLQPTSN